MKKRTVSIVMPLVVLMLLTTCHENIIDKAPENNGGIKAFANMNPDEPIILDVSNEQGASMVVMGSKKKSGHPEALQHVLITMPEEETPTEIFFNEEELVDEIIASNGVRFLFEWLSKTQVAVTLVDPNTNEQLNTLVNLNNSEGDVQLFNIKNVNDGRMPRNGVASLTVTPIMLKQKASLLLPSSANHSGGITGNVYVEQCGAPDIDAQCWVDVYDYSDLTGSFGLGKYRGRFNCTQVGEGYYQYTLPTNYHEHHNIADYCDAINEVVGKICDLNAWTAPGTFAKQALCIQISAALAAGIVSAPVAAVFGTACVAVSTALDTGCGLINGNMDLPEGTPNLVDGLCAALREMDYTWDTPLVLMPVLNALPSCIYGSRQIYEANTELKDMKIVHGSKPSIPSFKLVPSAPSAGVDYAAIAELHCCPPGTTVVMDIIGTDGYTNTQKTNIDSNSNLNFTATLNVPGAASGVKDVCTVTVITPSGETLTKKASLVFQ